MNFETFKSEFTVKTSHSANPFITPIEGILAGFNTNFIEDDIALVMMKSNSFGIANILILNIGYPASTTTLFSFEIESSSLNYINDDLAVIDGEDRIKITCEEDLQGCFEKAFRTKAVLRVISNLLNLNKKNEIELPQESNKIDIDVIRHLFRGEFVQIDFGQNPKIFDYGSFRVKYLIRPHQGLSLETDRNGWSYSFR